MSARWPSIPSDFVYPVCQVCGEPTPMFSKKGTRITHAKRLKAKTCGSAKCFGAMIGRPKTRGNTRGTNFPHTLSELDFGFQFFNFDRGRLERFLKELK